MSDSAVVDTTYLLRYKEELDEVFRIYLEDINPYIVQFEILKGEFPIELQNEIRAMYGHLARASLATDPEEVRRNIGKMKSHTKRALLDCYKYSCITFADRYDAFFQTYHGVDLSYLNDGKFLPRVHLQYKSASEKLLEAKRAETSNVSEESLFTLYQDAYNLFADLDQQLLDAEAHATFLKHKATLRSHMGTAGFIVGALGLLVGVLSLIF